MLSLSYALSVFGLIGLIVGSFLNVVILRLPAWLEHQWQCEAHAMLELPAPAHSVANLAFPPSHCPACQHPLRWWHLIPLLGFGLLRGRCAFCKTPISPQYPAVELINTTWWLVCMWHAQGDWTQATWWALWGSVLLALAWIDAQTLLLPDALTLPLLWAALGAAAAGISSVSATMAIWGAVFGYAILAIPAELYRKLSGQMGMAPGDFKLMAAIGASFGPKAIPAVVLAASLLGLVWGLFQAWSQRRHQSQEDWPKQVLPFGPALVIAAVLQQLAWLPALGLEW